MFISKKNLFLLFFSIVANSQNIFTYEKEVDSIENYISTEINIDNTIKKIILSGKLLQPKKEFNKIVIIVPGSGKDTRHSHFKLSASLLKEGIAVYRFDERGIGKSGGKYSELAKDLSEDLNFALGLKNFGFLEALKTIWAPQTEFINAVQHGKLSSSRFIKSFLNPTNIRTNLL